MSEKEKKGLNISVKSFLTAILIIFALMVVTYLLTFVVSGGSYTDGVFQAREGGIPFWKWLLSPVLVLGAEGNGSLIAVIIFLLVIGGVFNSLDRSGLMRYLLDRISFRFGGKRYRLLACVTLFFMGLGTMVGSFEECVPLVPIVVALSVSLGWNALVGLGMSILAAGCGFAAGICNPFTVGVAQELAGLPIFSGMWLRALAFLLIYGLLVSFLIFYARKVERPVGAWESEKLFDKKGAMDKGLICFVSVLGLGILTVISSVFITALQDLTMIIVAVMFLIAGVTSVLISGRSISFLGKTFREGLVSVFPAVLMILMANSIKYTMTEAHILDTVLYNAIRLAEQLPSWSVILFVYMIVLVMNFFIPSGSAKAFLLMPLIIPVAQAFGISAQLCVVAFCFGDGFSNVFYPTNPVLLISLGLADVSYGKWAKWSAGFQFVNLALTGIILMLGLVIGY